MKKHYLILFLAFFMASCGDESFAPKRQYDAKTANPVEVSSANNCAAFTHIKPKVDFLFLWDNSTSSAFINPSTKAALNNTINGISSRFDFHIMLAPLVVSGSNPINYQAKLITSTPDNLSASANNMRIDPSLAAQSLNFSYSQGSKEEGIKRSIDLIKANISNGIFRGNAYTYVILMSNQDDSSWVRTPPAAADQQNYLNAHLKEFLCLRGSYVPGSGSCTGVSLNATEMRFMSITAFTDKANTSYCGGLSSWQKGDTYQKFSKNIYLTPYNVGGQIEYRQADQNTRSDAMYDAYNICSQSDFSKIFDGINGSIEDTLIKHKYNFWPVASLGSAAIDPNEIRVFKNGVEQPKLSFDPGQNTTYNGFYFHPNPVTNQNTRYEPSAGEPFSGYVVELFGNSRVTHPECIRVQTQTPKEFFGYVNLQTKPVENSIKLEINGVSIPQSSTNGWELIKEGGEPKYFSSKNIKIKNPSDCATSHCPETPALNQSGFFLKVNGSAIYSNGATVEVLYDPRT